MAPALVENETSKKVCVMDASGYLGSSLVDQLIHRGYTVHAAVQTQGGDLQQQQQQVFKKTPHNSSSSSSRENKSRLKIFEADPLDYHSIIDALRGCCALFYSFEPPRDQPIVFDEFMADEEVRAAHNVLEACAQTETMEKVVFTSSVTAVIWRQDRDNKSTPTDFDEKSWSDVNFCRKFKLWHALSKTLAEKTAWALAMDRNVQMVSINAGLLLSPELCIKSPYLKGAAEMYQDGVLVTVDLNYLVDAHISIFQDISTYGRYLCFNHVINHPDDALTFAQILTPLSSAAATSLPPPQSFGDAKCFEQRISCNKLEKMMLEFNN